MTLVQAAAALGQHVSVKVLRAEVRAGRLRCYRLRPGSNSKILLSEHDIVDWLQNVAGNRQRVFRQRDVHQNSGETNHA